METNTMGRVLVRAKIENLGEIYSVSLGLLPEDKVHRLEVTDALVDTGCTFLSMPKRLIEQLGFRAPSSSYRAQTTNGPVTRGLYGPVRLTIEDRFCSLDVAEVPEDCPVLIGQIPLEALDYVVDPGRQCLIGNPRHGGERMMEQY